ncbi:MAG TPA: hypothetical protein VJP40_00810, partial [bacterium]|nr:hypothetical protein [bacterium]
LLFTIFFILFFHSSAQALSLIEVPGSALPNLLGKPVAAIRVVASDGNGGLKPVPFQIDERRGVNGPWILDQETNGAGTFDAFDVLLLASDDAGTLFDASKLPPASVGHRIAIEDKYVAAYLAEPNAPRSEKTYVRYVPAQDRVSTAFYEAAFRPSQPLIQDILIPQNGSVKADVLDRFKVRFNLAIKNFFDFKVGEGDVDARLAGTRVGALRVIRRVVASKKLGPIKLIPTATIDFFFYPDWMEVPTKVQNPVDGPKFLDAKTEGLSGYDFSRSAYGTVIRSSLNGDSWTLDGRPDSAASGAGQALGWWSFSGSAGSFVVGIQNDPQLNGLGIQPILKVIDDASLSAPPEGEAGESFVGFDLPYAKIPKGTFWIRVKQVFPYRFQAGQEANYLQNAKTTAPKAVEAL